MSRKTKTDADTIGPLYLLIKEDRSHGYFHLIGRIVGHKHQNGSWQPYGPDDDYRAGLLYSGLQLCCQGDHDSRRRTITGDREEPVYGFDVTYHDVYSVDRRCAVRMAKTLQLIETKLSRLQEKRGYVRTYGEYCGRVAEVLGCDGVCLEREPNSHTAERWRWETIGDGINHINRKIAAWVDEARPKPEPAAAEPTEPAADAGVQA
jgi:hypothetical protein